MKRLALLVIVALLFAAPAVAQVTAPIPVKLPSLLAVAQTVKASKGVINWMACYNPNASVTYIQIFDNAAPTVGTTPAVLAIPVPATSSVSIPIPSQYFTAITVAATTTPGGSTAQGAVTVCNFGIN